MPQTLVAADLDLATNVGGNLASEVTLDLEVLVDPVAQGDDLVVGEALRQGLSRRAFGELKEDPGRPLLQAQLLPEVLELGDVEPDRG